MRWTYIEQAVRARGQPVVLPRTMRIAPKGTDRESQGRPRVGPPLQGER